MVHCTACNDRGRVCEDHPERPWGNPDKRSDVCDCGGAGMHCPKCCSPIPEDGTRSIAEAFTPDWERTD